MIESVAASWGRWESLGLADRRRARPPATPYRRCRHGQENTGFKSRLTLGGSRVKAYIKQVGPKQGIQTGCLFLLAGILAEGRPQKTLPLSLYTGPRQGVNGPALRRSAGERKVSPLRLTKLCVNELQGDVAGLAHQLCSGRA